MPSVSSDAKASASAWAQSMPPSSPSATRRRSSCLTSFGWTVKPSGCVSSSSLRTFRRSALTAVLTSGEGERSSWYSPVCCSTVPASSLAWICALRFWCSAASSSQISWVCASTSGLRDRPGLDQLLGVQLGDARVLLDLRGHLRLRVGGLVGLVVAEAAVADEVDQDVVAELLAEREREAHRMDAGAHVVGVDVDDRDVEALRQVRGPAGRPRVLGIGGEADLVVGDDVHRAADLVAVEGLQVQRLRDDALAGEGRVAVQHDRRRPRSGRGGRAGPGAWSAPRARHRGRPGARTPGATGCSRG